MFPEGVNACPETLYNLLVKANNFSKLINNISSNFNLSPSLVVFYMNFLNVVWFHLYEIILLSTDGKDVWFPRSRCTLRSEQRRINKANT